MSVIFLDLSANAISDGEYYYAVQHLLFSCVKLARPGLADFSAERYTPGSTIGGCQQVQMGATFRNFHIKSGVRGTFLQGTMSHMFNLMRKAHCEAPHSFPKRLDILYARARGARMPIALKALLTSLSTFSNILSSLIKATYIQPKEMRKNGLEVFWKWRGISWKA